MMNLIEKLIEYITTNSKDFANICYWIFTALLALAAYKNAKKTLFNPIRGEMVKYQMKVVTEFIDKHLSKNIHADSVIDYSNILKLTVETDYLFAILNNVVKLENHNFDKPDIDRLAFCQANLGGLFEVIKSLDKQHMEFFEGNFDITKKYVRTKSVKNKEENNQDLSLQRLYVTSRFCNFYSDLENLENNPFIPKKIQIDIKFFHSNIYKNLIIIYDLLATYNLDQNGITYQDVYLQFIDRRIDHKKDLERLRKNISIYFKVNNV